jgi:uncharacterized protein YndB with AHSA1/START domain
MRYLLIVVGFLVAAVAVIALVGLSLPVRHQASVEQTFRTNPPALFALISDPASYPSWRSEVTHVDVLPETNGQRRWTESTKSGSPITYLAERTIPDRLLVSRIATANLPFGGAWTYELTPAGAGLTSLRITEDGEVYNPIFRFVSRFVMGHDGTIKQYLASVERKFPAVAANIPPR